MINKEGFIFAGILVPVGADHEMVVETMRAALPLDKRHLVQTVYLAPGEEKSLSITAENDRPEVDFNSLLTFDSGDYIARKRLIDLIDAFETLIAKKDSIKCNLMIDDIARDLAKSSGDAYRFCVLRLRGLLPSPPILEPSPENIFDFHRIGKSDVQSVIGEITHLLNMSTERSLTDSDFHSRKIAQASAEAYAECVLQLGLMIS